MKDFGWKIHMEKIFINDEMMEGKLMKCIRRTGLKKTASKEY